MFYLDSIGPTELLLILLIVIIIFGARKLPDLGKSLGDGIKNFKKSMNTKDDEDKTSKKNDNSRQLTRHATDHRRPRRGAPGEGRGTRPERRLAEGRPQSRTIPGPGPRSWPRPSPGWKRPPAPRIPALSRNRRDPSSGVGAADASRPRITAGSSTPSRAHGPFRPHVRAKRGKASAGLVDLVGKQTP